MEAIVHIYPPSNILFELMPNNTLNNFHVGTCDCQQLAYFWREVTLRLAQDHNMAYPYDLFLHNTQPLNHHAHLKP